METHVQRMVHLGSAMALPFSCNVYVKRIIPPATIAPIIYSHCSHKFDSFLVFAPCRWQPLTGSYICTQEITKFNFALLLVHL